MTTSCSIPLSLQKYANVFAEVYHTVYSQQQACDLLVSAAGPITGLLLELNCVACFTRHIGILLQTQWPTSTSGIFLQNPLYIMHNCTIRYLILSSVEHGAQGVRDWLRVKLKIHLAWIHFRILVAFNGTIPGKKYDAKL